MNDIPVIILLGCGWVLLPTGTIVLTAGVLRAVYEFWQSRKHAAQTGEKAVERPSRDQSWDDNIATINRLRMADFHQDDESDWRGRTLIKIGASLLGVCGALTTMGIWMGKTGTALDLVEADINSEGVTHFVRVQFLIGLLLIVGFSIAAGGTRPGQHSSSWTGTATGLALGGLLLLTPTLQLAMPTNGIPVFCSLGLLVFLLGGSGER